jgi:hypothetical protein
MDSESLGVLQRAAADEVGLPSQFAGRLVGSTYDELRRDAKAFARQAGFAEAQPRNERGQFQSMNALIRAQAGRPIEPAEPPAVGDLGIGKGGSAIPRKPRSPSMNDLIRATHGVRVSAVADLAEQIATQEAGYG